MDKNQLFLNTMDQYKYWPKLLNMVGPRGAKTFVAVGEAHS